MKSIALASTLLLLNLCLAAPTNTKGHEDYKVKPYHEEKSHEDHKWDDKKDINKPKDDKKDDYEWKKWDDKDDKDEHKPKPKYDHKDYKPDWYGKGDKFTSYFEVIATPEQVVNNISVPTPGEYGAKGYFKYAINSHEDKICYDITLDGVSGEYSSPAKTATHIHEGVKGKAGPPRITFPNPVGHGKVRKSVGCVVGPFTTGILVNGNDSGLGFKVKQIEANPSGFFTDTHTTKFLASAVRGQLPAYH